jgi:hypothetical protein
MTVSPEWDVETASTRRSDNKNPDVLRFSLGHAIGAHGHERHGTGRTEEKPRELSDSVVSARIPRPR